MLVGAAVRYAVAWLNSNTAKLDGSDSEVDK
jgi:hypothetical protein